MALFSNIPIHNNSHHSNQTFYWHGTDSNERWLKNMNDAKNSEFFKMHGWDNPEAFTYSYNSHGFRCKEFDDDPCYLALGCSHTEGDGLPKEQTWPNQLSTKLDYPVLNLGVGGASFDTVVRLLDYYIDKLNIKGVFILEPPAHRFEFFEQTIPITYMATDSHPNLIYKHWIASEYNTETNVKKNRQVVQWICHANNIRLIEFESNIAAEYPIINIEYSRARDLMHHGKETHQYIANRFYFAVNS